MRPHHLFLVSAGVFAAAGTILNRPGLPPGDADWETLSGGMPWPLAALAAVAAVLVLWTVGYILNNRRAARAAGIRLAGRKADIQVLANRSPAEFTELLDTVFSAAGLYYRRRCPVPGGMYTFAKNRTVVEAEHMFVIAAPGPDGTTLVRVAAEQPPGTLNWGEAGRQVRLLLAELVKWDTVVREGPPAEDRPEDGTEDGPEDGTEPAWPKVPLTLEPAPAGWSELPLPAQYPEWDPEMEDDGEGFTVTISRHPARKDKA